MATALYPAIDQEGVMVVRFDVPDRSVNTLSSKVLDELDDLISSLERGEGLVRGVIFTSAKRDFISGADLFELSQLDAEGQRRQIEHGQRLFDRIAALPVPTVAAINGHALGGGLELALACRRRVAVDDGSINIGLPEIKLGLIPAWGGTTRMTREIGLTRTLPLMLAGKTLPPRKALKAGLLDDVVRPEALLYAARRWLHTNHVGRRLGWSDRVALSTPPLLDMICRRARRATLAKTYGNYPAPERLIDVARTAAREGHEAGLAAEREVLVALAQTQVSHNLVRLFFLRTDAKRAAHKHAAQAMPVNRAAVVGGGTMGAGIVHAMVSAGLPVRLVDVDAQAMSKALGRVRKQLDEDVRRRTMSRLGSQHAIHRVSPTTDWSGLQLADVVVEAVAEKMEVKRQVFADLDRLTRDHAVLASNTSSLDIAEMAAATKRPDQVIGLHFFNPVAQMPLVEVVRTDQTDERAVATGIALALRIGKIPILVRNAPGFLVNRILIPYLAEAVTAAAEGLPIREIDQAMKRWGMPMGPFELLDQVGLDIAADIFRSIGPKLGDHISITPGFEKVVQRGWLGRKAGRGFYIHDQRGWPWPGRQKPQVNDELIVMLAGERKRPTDQTIDHEAMQWRLVLPMVNEAARVLLERVTDSTDTIDLATVLGLGLAPFRGGLVQFAQTAGLKEVVGRMDELARTLGPRFTPVPELRAAAEADQPMQALAERPIPAPTPGETPVQAPQSPAHHA